LSIKVQPIKYREGGNNQVVHSLAGQVEYGVTLHYGLTSSRELWDWLLTAVVGRVERKNVSILMPTARHVRGDALELDRRVAVAMAGTPDALGREVAIESLMPSCSKRSIEVSRDITDLRRRLLRVGSPPAGLVGCAVMEGRRGRRPAHLPVKRLRPGTAYALAGACGCRRRRRTGWRACAVRNELGRTRGSPRRRAGSHTSATTPCAGGAHRAR
jgi:phage tail-like protein